MSLERLEGEYPRPFARHHYDRFWRTSRAMGWKPMTPEDFRSLMKPYADACAAVLADDSPTPLMKLASKRRFGACLSTRVVFDG